ncbi:glycosyltransferase family 1 protein [Lactococcus lactis]|uniref:beta 1-4 rhamnosyltransferase Cps2T n=1 Tax=Lactococcus lactis TaxID=1358 RepID=UPI001F0D7AFE|nr:glycosyltransferase family 1 protein [Lactococcus lactis]MCH5427903.1 glycosyltransferase family 1 protein [Lactococcus lactis]MCT0086433.1 glycosyltransferase family 1 protein [Lactococcus lactis subsp. lactis]
MKEKHIYIIGSKGIPAKYGGFETFVEELTAHQSNKKLKYHVACLSNDIQSNFIHNGADCFNIPKKNIGPANAIYYDLAALKYSLKEIEDNNYKGAIIYILACRIGPFIGHYKKQMKKLEITLMVNPDGHEWLRAKWSTPVKKYWKISEQYMVKNADLLICDSKNIEKYIQEDYAQYNPKTTYIAYGADLSPSLLKDNDEKLVNWFQEKGLESNEYYLVVGRFVPENNYEVMIREFMLSNSTKSLVLITNVEKNKFYDLLREKTSFDKDKRIRFVGTVYDKELIKKIRENAFAYFHGHEVGGTNPSLIEALVSTKLNLLLDVGFNREVGEDGALYWLKDKNHLASLINEIENSREEYDGLEQKAKQRIAQYFSWEYIVEKYEKVFKN